jgi:hypothetical protein
MARFLSAFAAGESTDLYPTNETPVNIFDNQAKLTDTAYVKTIY